MAHRNIDDQVVLARSVVRGCPHAGHATRKKEPEGLRARRKPKLLATLSPSGSGAPSNLLPLSWFPGGSTLSWGFGVSRASPPGQPVCCPDRTPNVAPC